MRCRRLSPIWCIVAALLLSGCSGSKQLYRESGVSIPVRMYGSARTGAEDHATFPPYRLAAGDEFQIIYKFLVDPVDKFTLMPLDTIEVKFPASPELNELQQVRLDGMISIAYVGEIRAAGRSPEEIATELRARLAPTLKNPDVYVVVREFGVQTLEIKEAVSNATTGQVKFLSIRPDGFVTFPVIGEVKAVDLTVPELTAVANALYTRKNPNVKVDLLLQGARRSQITILGAVGRPGTYSIDHPLTILEAFALAGGLRDDAKQKNVLTWRKEEGHMIANMINVKPLLKGDSAATVVMVGMEDTIFVTRSRMARASQFMSYLTNILFLRAIPVPVV